jgi:serine/threonine protein kinase
VKPQTIGEFELGELLGTGTVGNAYRARHRESGQPAVIKLLQTHAAIEPEVQRRFVREVAITEKLNHPNIVRHYDCGLCDDQIYFAMELVDCGTLKDVLRRRGRLPWGEAVECAIQICAALEYAHQLGIIHRDLKPANLFLAHDGRVKVGDFGLARDLNNTRLTLDGQTVGTCRYMPPEQITGQADLTGAVDLYALGCMLYEMLVGRTPFNGSTIVEVFEAHLHGNATPPADLANCPAELSELVMQLLAKRPAERPASAAAVGAALAGILRGQPVDVSNRPTDRPASTASEPIPSTVAPRGDLAAASDSNDELPNLTQRLLSGGPPDATTVAIGRIRIVFGVIAAVIVVAIVVAALR